jgi:hypothetical protein
MREARMNHEEFAKYVANSNDSSSFPIATTTE